MTATVTSLHAKRPLHAKDGDTGAILVWQGRISADDLAQCRATAARQDTTLEDILELDLGVARADVAAAQALAWNASLLLDAVLVADPRLFAQLAFSDWITHESVPLRRVGGEVLIATHRPEVFERLRKRLLPEMGPVRMALAGRDAIEQAALNCDRERLVEHAQTCVAEDESCRTMRANDGTKVASAGLLGAVMVFASAPVAVFAALFVLAAGVLAINTLLKLWMTLLALRPAPSLKAPDNVKISRLPCVTVLVPLFREKDIAARLIKRLSRLDYPRALLDICLVAEERDQETRRALEQVELPGFMRVIVVPDRSLRTKPRAMNFALNVARGTIVGIYDAEDAPDPDQITKVVEQFHRMGPKVAALQGRLDYYNARTNWLSRCFTVEYASWFRVMLPGFARAGFPVPLGGTTVFMRRDVLRELGGWDAHNVTEDADLGIRLARRGYRTELIDSVTREEANCRPIPWIKQRSRWLKGYAVTYLVHMRRPLQLWRDLGSVGFLGMQLLFLGTLLGFLTAPLLLSFWLVSLGVAHPATAAFAPGAVKWFWIAFVVAELISIMLGLVAIRRAGHGRLAPWVPSLHFYFPLASLAMIKALYELVLAPFYWDKTSHGHFDEEVGGPVDQTQ